MDQATPQLLYENTFASPQEQQRAEARREWIMEGGGIAEWKDGHLRLRSRHYTPDRSKIETDHFVYWLNKEFPGDFAVEWDFRYPPPEVSPNGLAIIFFCAKGIGGQDIFDPSLGKREGRFARYYDGDINCYHISYIAIDRGTSNLRKNKGFYLPASGPDLVSGDSGGGGGPEKWHHLRLSCLKAAIELTVDGQRCLAWTDDGKTYGPVHAGGKIGLRQQNNLFYGDYTNLRVYCR